MGFPDMGHHAQVLRDSTFVGTACLESLKVDETITGTERGTRYLAPNDSDMWTATRGPPTMLRVSSFQHLSTQTVLGVHQYIIFFQWWIVPANPSPIQAVMEGSGMYIACPHICKIFPPHPYILEQGWSFSQRPSKDTAHLGVYYHEVRRLHLILTLYHDQIV